MPLDLWSPLTPQERQHNNFRVIMMHGDTGAASRDVISAWAEGFPDRDGKFAFEFQTTFDSAFWELYLHACFNELKLAPTMSHPAPDFLLNVGEQSVAAEARIASNADGFRPEWDKYGVNWKRDLADLYQRVRYCTVRLANAFAAKVKEYRENYGNLAHVKDKPFLLCIAPFDQPFTFDLAYHAMRRVLYRADEPIFHRDPKTGEPIVFGSAEMSSATKDSGAEVPLGVFCCPSFSEVSAVIFSTTATWGKVRALSQDLEPYTVFRAERYNAYGTTPLLTVAKKPQYCETLLDGLTLCLNPFAVRPLDISPFLNREIAIETWDKDRELHIGGWPHEFLLRRFCMTARPVQNLGAIQSPRPRSYKQISVPHWPDGELRAVPVEMWPAVDQHMSHIAGWTVVVFRDDVDDTWHALAIHRIVHTIPEFREKNKDDNVPTLSALEDHVSREEAFSSIKVLIANANPDPK